MQRESIEDLIARDEFKPFKIITTAGLGYDISNPHNIALGQTEFAIFPKSPTGLCSFPTTISPPWRALRLSLAHRENHNSDDPHETAK